MKKIPFFEIREISAQETWEIRHQVMWPEKDIEYVILPKDPTGKHFGAFIDGKLISVISLFIDNKKAQFRKFATLQNCQGNGYGSRLLEFVLYQATKYQVNMIWCNARVNKVYFYQRFGLTQTGQFFTKEGKHYEIMQKELT